MNIKDIVKGNTVEFKYLRHGIAYYSVRLYDTRPNGDYVSDPSYTDYYFPVPLDDLGDATINRTEKAMFLMRYIRKALDEGTFVKG